MPYDNEQNREIKRKIALINRNYIAHSDMLGTANTINYRNPSVEPDGPSLLGHGHGRVIGGGSGCAEYKSGGARKKYGAIKDGIDEMSGGAILGLQDGTIAGDMSKPIYRSKKPAPTQMPSGSLGDSMVTDMEKSHQSAVSDSKLLKPKEKSAGFTVGDAQKDMPLEGAGFFDDVWSGIKSVGKVAKPFISMIPHPAAQIAAQGMDMAGMGKHKTNEAKGEMKKTRGRPRKTCGCKKKCDCRSKTGGNGFAAGTFMDTGFGSTLGAVGKGRKSKTGGAILGLVKGPVSGKLDSSNSEEKPAFGNKKITKQSTSKMELTKPVPKAQMPSSTLSGLGKTPGYKSEGKEQKTKVKRAPSKRNEIVKKVMTDRGVSLMEASKIVKAEGLYTK
jgi:hypothetical protein